MKPQTPPVAAQAAPPAAQTGLKSALPRHLRLSGLVRMHLARAGESKRPDLLLRRFDPPQDAGTGEKR